jgi:integrase
MPKIPWTRFRSEVISLYTPPLARKTTFVKIRGTLRLLDGLGVRTTADLTSGLVARLLTANAARWKRATAKGHLSYLGAICAHGVREGWLRSNPVAAKKDWLRGWPVEPEEEESDHLSLDQVADLLAEARRQSAPWKGGRSYALVALVAYTGLRRTEALTRQVSDFDLERRILRLRPSSYWQPKTSGSAQPVPIPAALVPTLETWFRRCGSPWAFPATRGEVPWTSGEIGRRPLDALKSIGAEAGIPRVTFQLLRHSWATHAEHWGLGELMVQRVLRHTTTRTQRHYRHADLINLANAVRDISFREREAG